MNDEFLQLYKKFLEGRCTDEEKERLLAYQDQWAFEENDQELTEEERAVKLKTYHAITKTLSKRPVRLKYWYYAAAAVLVIVGSTLWLLPDNQPEKPAATVAATIKTKNDSLHKPGGNVAILTLGNGSQLRLDQVKTGALTVSGASFVQKVNNGHLVYNDNAAAVTYNTITVPRGNLFRLTLPDGTEVWLNAETSLIFPTRFTGSNRQVELKGEAYFEVAKASDMPFRVKANGTVVDVLGTHFNVSAYPEEKQVKTTLLEGSVKLSNNFTQTVIQPGQEGSLNISSNTIKIAQARGNEAIAWKDGLFIFHNEGIASILKKAERWYDVDVVYEGDVPDNEFGGSISKYKDISELLHVIEMTTTIHYKIEGRRVTIMK